MGRYSKAIGASLGGALATIIVWLLNTYVVAQPLDEAVVAAIVTVVTAATTYWAPANTPPAPKPPSSTVSIVPLLFMVVVLTGCAGSTLRPETPNQRFLATAAAIDAVSVTVLAECRSGTLSRDACADAAGILGQAAGAVEAGWGLYTAGSRVSGEDQLILAAALLAQARALLAARLGGDA